MKSGMNAVVIGNYHVFVRFGTRKETANQVESKASEQTMVVRRFSFLSEFGSLDQLTTVALFVSPMSGDPYLQIIIRSDRSTSDGCATEEQT
jgi:hypothetical protein